MTEYQKKLAVIVFGVVLSGIGGVLWDVYGDVRDMRTRVAKMEGELQGLEERMQSALDFISVTFSRLDSRIDNLTNSRAKPMNRDELEASLTAILQAAGAPAIDLEDLSDDDITSRLAAVMDTIFKVPMPPGILGTLTEVDAE